MTFKVHQWADVFTRAVYIEDLLNSLRYCQSQKGLEIFAWVIMSNDLHLIIRAKNENLSDVIRDFKKFISKAIYKAITEKKKESRREWLLKVLNYDGKIWFWEEVNYLHFNPFRAGIVEKEEDYLNSSAGEFFGLRKSKLELSIFG